jgi:uncharacterized protein (UPF0261 family)
MLDMDHNTHSAMSPPHILVVGTVDTKSDEINFLCEQVLAAGGVPHVMDVGVLGDGTSSFKVAVSNVEVARAAGMTLEDVRTSGDENSAMQAMATGAARVAVQWHAAGRMHGLVALGGTMGTDLSLEVASALPLGVPKVVLSTVSFSPLLPAERLAPDLMMVLWSGGLYGLNALCRASLAQAAGAVVGACRVARAPTFDRPVVGMTSLGLSALKYMAALKPALDERGFELAVFHTTGMGGRAFESLAAQGKFCCVMDFSLQELVNHLGGSLVTSGAGRLTGAGQSGTPQIVAPGATDMVDYPAWAGMPARFAGRASHEHNRLIASVCIDADMRREVAREMAARLAAAKGAVHLILPMHGIEEWDREGAPLHDAPALAAFFEELGRARMGQCTVQQIDAHINDAAFVTAVLATFDAWVADGTVSKQRV